MGGTIPVDALAWLRTVFAECNKRITEKLSANPNVPEESLDFTWVEHGGTRLIAVSAVHSPIGYQTDLAALSRVAARSGTWLFENACQAAGAVPLDVVRDGVDFLALGVE